ncbi:hypothetical protein [Kaarinaea lacus]
MVGIKRHAVLILFLIVVIFSTGCGSTRYVVPEVAGDSCEVYVFRDSFLLLWSMYIDVAGQTYAKLSDETYTKFKLPVGRRVVHANWAPGTGGIDLDVPFNCEANKTHYLVFFGYVTGNKRIIKGGQISQSKAEYRITSYQLAGG